MQSKHQLKSKKVWKVSRLFGKFQDSLESFRTVWKVSGQSGKFPDGPKSFQTGWKVSGRFGKFWDSLECSGQSGKVPDSLESFLTVWIVSRRPEKLWTVWNISRHLESFQTVWKVSRQSGKFLDGPGKQYIAKAIYALLAHICRKNDLRTPSGKFLRVKFCRPESFDFLCPCWGDDMEDEHVDVDVWQRTECFQVCRGRPDDGHGDVDDNDGGVGDSDIDDDDGGTCDVDDVDDTAHRGIRHASLDRLEIKQLLGR